MSTASRTTTPVEVPCAAFDGPLTAAGKFPSLRPLLEYLSGAGSRVDLATLDRLLRQLLISRAELGPACQFSDAAYRRNTIARTEWFELVCLCWRSGQVTPIHDHRGSSCAFRVVEGVGTEVRYQHTPSGLVLPVGSVQMPPGYVCAAQDADIHQVANAQAPGTDLITLHTYSPPIQRMHSYPFAQVCADEIACPVDGFDPVV